MLEIKVGSRVYYSIYYEDKYFSEAPSMDQKISIIETMVPFDDYYVITLEAEKFTLVLMPMDNDNILKGEALENSADEPKKKGDVAKAFVTLNYLNYSRETILYYKRILAITPRFDTDWNGDEYPNWRYTTTLASMQKLLKRLKSSRYRELYPEDFV